MAKFPLQGAISGLGWFDVSVGGAELHVPPLGRLDSAPRARVLWTSFPELNVSRRLRILVSQKERERTGQGVWFCLSLFLKLCMLAYQTLVCASLRTAVFIATVSVPYWKSAL